MTSWVGKIINKVGNVIYLQCTFPTGEDAFYVLKVRAEKKSELEEKLNQKISLNLEEYGEILDSGWGILPLKYN